MKRNSLKTALALLLALASLLTLAACAAKPAAAPEEAPSQEQPAPETPAETQETPAEPETPDTQPEPVPETQPSEEETPVHQASDEELLRLIEQQDAEYPGHTPYLAERINDANGDVTFKVAFRSASGWLVYAAKAYTASFNDDGGHIIASETLLSTEDAPQLSAQATDPETLLPLLEKMEIGMTGEHGFTFTDASEFTCDELYTAYLLLADEDELQARYNDAEGKYFISARHVDAVLDRYFTGYSWDISKCSNFDPTFKGIVADIVDGFGGARFMKVEQVTPNEAERTVELLVSFYTDADLREQTEQKVYTLSFYDDGYRYLSAVPAVEG